MFLFTFAAEYVRYQVPGIFLRRIIIAYLELILEYCAGFYERQFKTEITADNDILKRFDDLLKHYYRDHGVGSTDHKGTKILIK